MIHHYSNCHDSPTDSSNCPHNIQAHIPASHVGDKQTKFNANSKGWVAMCTLLNYQPYTEHTDEQTRSSIILLKKESRSSEH